MLLTRQMHVPRLAGVFRPAGWPVLPFLAGFRSRPGSGKRLPMMCENLQLLDTAAHECAWNACLMAVRALQYVSSCTGLSAR